MREKSTSAPYNLTDYKVRYTYTNDSNILNANTLPTNSAHWLQLNINQGFYDSCSGFYRPWISWREKTDHYNEWPYINAARSGYWVVGLLHSGATGIFEDYRKLYRPDCGGSGIFGRVVESGCIVPSFVGEDGIFKVTPTNRLYYFLGSDSGYYNFGQFLGGNYVCGSSAYIFNGSSQITYTPCLYGIQINNDGSTIVVSGTYTQMFPRLSKDIVALSWYNEDVSWAWTLRPCFTGANPFNMMNLNTSYETLTNDKYKVSVQHEARNF